MTPEEFTALVSELAEALTRHRFIFSGEKQFQAQIETVFASLPRPMKREYRLSARDIPDFYLLDENVAIEVKSQGGPETHLAQLKRYADYPQVVGVILVSSKAGTVPASLSGKPVGLISLWRNVI